MAPIDPEDLSDAEDSYHESSDEDFNPAATPANDSPSSSEAEDTSSKPTQTKRKRKIYTPDCLDSGDEVTIEAALKRKAKKRKGGNGDDVLQLSDHEGGEGGLVKTRAQRRVELKERRPLVRTEGATVDVDALWAQMSAGPLQPLYISSAEVQAPNTARGQDDATDVHTAPLPADGAPDMVTVEKIYTFAGQRTTEEKQVSREYLDQYAKDGWRTVEPAAQAASGDVEDKTETATPSHPRVYRPLRRPSRFDANPTGFVRGIPSEYQLAWSRKSTAVQADQANTLEAEPQKAPRVEKAQKLNVVDKSRLDWTGFVHQEGIAEELDVHGKTKEAYLGRMQFLAGVEAKQEEERKRVKTTATA